MSLLTVGQLNRYVRSLLEADDTLNDLTVNGEIQDFHRHFKSGHLYFTLKDEEAIVKCVMFASAAARLRFEPEDGMSVILRGRASLYDKGGQYQLYAEMMNPDGEGMARLALQRLYEKLAAEGLFSPERKLPLPRYPERVAVLSSASGAALHDVRAVIGRRWPIAELKLYPVGVQGDRAVGDILTAFDKLSKRTTDVVILTRGGGSAEDLAVFNDERVVRAVAACPVPVIAAVGHEVDVTLAEIVASARASTPSAAAELAVPDIGEVQVRIFGMERSFRRYGQRTLEMAVMRYELALSSPVMKDPLTFVKYKEDLMDNEVLRLKEKALQVLHRTEERHQSQTLRLDALSPLKTLARGFCVAAKDGRTIKSVSQIKTEDELSLTFADGDAACRIL